MARSPYEHTATVEPSKTPAEGDQVTEDLTDPANSKEEPRARGDDILVAADSGPLSKTAAR